jgi:RecB family endonuclease NucS
MNEAERSQILDLLGTGLSTDDVARQLGVSKGTVSAVKAHMTMGSYSPVGGELADVEQAADLKFGLERDMQDALRRHIEQLDPTLRIVDDGRERRVDSGFIDILAEDDQGVLVVIELKAAEAPEAAIAQVLSYVGALQKEETRAVRAILVAREFSTRLRLAAQAAGIQLVKYGYEFRFTRIEREEAVATGSSP